MVDALPVLDGLNGPKARARRRGAPHGTLAAMLGRGAGRRWSLVLVLGLSPVAALGWMGCSDDDSSAPSVLGKPDPGGTWGAQVGVTVIGRGRVSTVGRGIDCPRASSGSSSGCAATVVFPNNAADGATGGLTLVAEPNPGGKFLGWTFEPATIGTSGRGPDRCNPVTRTASVPSVDVSALQITLPYGEMAGTPPTGREGECADAFRKVPLAYQLVATFSGDLVEAGVDGGLDDPTIYDLPAGGTSPVLIGRTSGGYLYWFYTEGAETAVAVGLSPESSSLPQSPTRITSVPTAYYRRVEPSGLVLMDPDGEISVVRQASPTTILHAGSSSGLGTCSAVAMDASSNVHCRLSSSIATWKFNGATYDATPTVTFTGLPYGLALGVDLTSLYYNDASHIMSVPLNGTDASAPATVVSSVTLSLGTPLLASSQRLAWLQSTGVFASSNKLPGASVTATSLTTTTVGNVQGFAFDPLDAQVLFAAGTKGIFGARIDGGATSVRTSPSITGMAVGNSHLFYTIAGESKIRRAPKPTL